jgi:hypothetical protein
MHPALIISLVLVFFINIAALCVFIREKAWKDKPFKQWVLSEFFLMLLVLPAISLWSLLHFTNTWKPFGDGGVK